MSRALVIVGAGPRTTGILLALAALPEVPATEIHVIDPYPAGPGRIWRAAQPTEVWMNNTSDEITVYADGDPAIPAAVPGPGLAEWAGERRFVPRRDAAAYLRDAAAYLRDAFDRAVAVLTDPATHPGITVTEHRTARSTSPRRTAASGRRVWQTAQNSGPMRCCWPRGISMSTRAIPAQSGRDISRPDTPSTRTSPRYRRERTSSSAGSVWPSSTSWRCSPKDAAAGSSVVPVMLSRPTSPPGGNRCCGSAHGAGCPTGPSRSTGHRPWNCTTWSLRPSTGYRGHPTGTWNPVTCGDC